MKRVILLLSGLLLLAGCKADDADAVKEYLIVDQNSNKILNRYEYTEITGQLVRTESYNGKEEIEKDIEYEYDSKGFLVKTIEHVPGETSRTVSYDTEPEYDSSGRLVKLVRTSSVGDVVETHFGYDETGTLRGVVEKDSRGGVLMQDY